MVSTPSANDFIPRAAANSTMDFTTDIFGSSESVTSMRSILRTSIGSLWERGEGSIAGAEIVERDSNPELTQLVEIPDRAIVHNTCLGDFELQQMRSQARIRQSFLHHRTELSRHQLHWRTVDRDTDSGRPPRSSRGRHRHRLRAEGMIIPVSSATEMNWLGPMRPRLGWFHRRRASKATTSPV